MIQKDKLLEWKEYNSLYDKEKLCDYHKKKRVTV